MNVDTTVHLAHVQAFFYKLESLAGENIILLYLFDKKKNFQVSKQFQSNFSAALSCEQRPFFLGTRLSSKILLSFVIVKSPKLNPVNRPKREHRRERIP